MDFAHFGPSAADLALLVVSGLLARCREPVQNGLFKSAANVGRFTTDLALLAVSSLLVRGSRPFWRGGAEPFRVDFSMGFDMYLNIERTVNRQLGHRVGDS